MSTVEPLKVDYCYLYVHHRCENYIIKIALKIAMWRKKGKHNLIHVLQGLSNKNKSIGNHTLSMR